MMPLTTGDGLGLFADNSSHASHRLMAAAEVIWRRTSDERRVSSELQKRRACILGWNNSAEIGIGAAVPKKDYHF
jgi:hypothetical protein